VIAFAEIARVDVVGERAPLRVVRRADADDVPGVDRQTPQADEKEEVHDECDTRAEELFQRAFADAAKCADDDYDRAAPHRADL